MATATQKLLIQSVAAETNLGGWAHEIIEKQIDSGELKVERKRDVRAWVAEQRAAGRDHLFNGPAPIKKKDDKPTVNPFHPSTYNITEAGRLVKVSPDLAASLAAKVGPGAFIGMTLEQATRAAAAKKALKD